jgi:general secretion pathway protein J
MKKPKLRSGRDHGFTLIEIIVSLTLAAMISTLIFSNLEFGRRVWEGGRSREANESDLVVFMTLINLLEKAIPISATSSSVQDVPILFEGFPDRLVFCTLSEGQTQIAGIVVMQIRNFERESLNSSTLILDTAVLRSNSFHVDQVPSANAVTIRDNTRISLRYFGKEASETEPAWHTTWLKQSELPKLISLQLISDHLDDSLRKPMIARLRAK